MSGRIGACTRLSERVRGTEETKEPLATTGLQRVSLMLSSRSLIVCAPMFTSVVHFEFLIVYSIYDMR